MKKRFSAFFLALALCLGLAAPAFAADTASDLIDIKIGVPDGVSPPVSTDTYQLRGASASKVTLRDKETNEAYSVYLVARAREPEDFSLTVCELPLGTTITVSNLRNDWSNQSKEVDILMIQAYSDPDGDGVYDQWIYNFDNEPPLVPFAEESVAFSASENGKYSHQAFITKDNHVGFDIFDALPDSVTVSADYLNEVFGPNTLILIQFQVWTVISSNPVTALPSENLGTMAYLITGEKAPDTPTTPEPAPSFTDLLPWCETEAKWAAEQEITNGYGGKSTFAPNVDCTQAQILTFLWRAEGKPQAAKAPITTAASYQDAINWAYEKKMIDSSFNPDAPCTRSQAVSYIWQALGKPDAKTAASFSDVAADAPYAGAVNWAVEKKITNGYGGNDTFAPDQVCKRGQIACFLYRAYNN